ncbi:methionyl-tRNA formyltransferase [Flavobacteriaceae bacterium F08102]|nr:methionyl-tRNA formyltransferase [Flavobacteriaceae bacterium F08102]
MIEPRIIFMGTPDFAVGILTEIIAQNYNVVGVITAPDRPAGRGLKINESAVKKYAKTLDLPILQPTNLKDPDFLKELAELKANIQVVVAFRMLPKVVWEMPQYGTFNLHASLLPAYRGAAPINWAIINGETETGVTTFFIDDKIDTGAVILQHKTSITPEDNASSLHDKLMHLGAKTVIETLELIRKEQVNPQPQPASNPKEAPKLFKHNCQINWNLTRNEIYNFIRGLDPYPAAWTTLVNGDQSVSVKIYSISQIEEEHHLTPGQIELKNSDFRVAVKNGFIKIHTLQLAGKRKMKSKDLLNGYRFHSEAKFM